MQSIFLQSINLADFKEIIAEVLEEKLEKIKQPVSLKSENTNYLNRHEVAGLLKISLTTLHDWSKRGILQSYRIGNRVLYKTSEIEQSLHQVKNLKYTRG